MEREYRKLKKAQDEFRQANQARSDDRNQKAGSVYEAQKALNDSVRLRLDAEYSADWIERWTR